MQTCHQILKILHFLILKLFFGALDASTDIHNQENKDKDIPVTGRAGP
jgi:hypothetical protein